MRVFIATKINEKAKEKALAAGVRVNDFQSVIEPGLSTYFARHTWGSLASKLEI